MVNPWVTGAMGWAFGGPLGGLIGYAAGTLINALAENATKAAKPPPRPPRPAPRASAGADRHNFAVSLLALTAAMMQADGRAMRSELIVAQKFFIQQFGRNLAQTLMPILRDLLREEIPVETVCRQIRANMSNPQRLTLLHYLYSLAYADGHLHPNEERLLDLIARTLGIRPADRDSIAAMFAPRGDKYADYRVLEVAPNATDDEIRKAYRRLSMKHHPDKVATLGPEFQRAATEKFQRINAAYSAIKKARGMT